MASVDHNSTFNSVARKRVGYKVSGPRTTHLHDISEAENVDMIFMIKCFHNKCQLPAQLKIWPGQYQCHT